MPPNARERHLRSLSDRETKSGTRASIALRNSGTLSSGKGLLTSEMQLNDSLISFFLKGAIFITCKKKYSLYYTDYIFFSI